MFEYIGWKNIDLQEIWDTTRNWAQTELWENGGLIELVIVAVSVLISAFVYTLIRRRLIAGIENAQWPVQVKHIASNLRKLVFPILSLILIFIGTAIISSNFAGNFDVTLNIGIMKVLLAWIIIRAAVQFIENSLIRNIFALIIWTVVALSILGVLEQTTEALDGIGFSIGEFRLSALAVIKGVLSIFILLYLAIFFSGFVENRVFKAKSLTRSSQVLIAKIIRVSLIVFALLIGITSAGIDLSLFAVFGGAIGLGIGFGLQKGISNLFSGMLLLMDRSIKPGDVIELPEMQTFGWVNQMAARYTEIITRDNKSVLIPNEDFITQRVVNWSHGNSLIRVSLDFGVSYSSDMEHVVAIAIEAAKKPERVVSFREPVCWMTEFGDSSVNFKLRFWIKDAEQGVTNVKGQVMMELWKLLKEHNINIPFPHREVFIHEGKEPAKPPKKKPASKKVEKKTETKAEKQSEIPPGKPESKPPAEIG